MHDDSSPFFGQDCVVLWIPSTIGLSLDAEISERFFDGGLVTLIAKLTIEYRFISMNMNRLSAVAEDSKAADGGFR